MPRKPFLSAAEATRELGVTAQTLYAYVSRGLIRSEPGPEGRKNRRYHAEDVRRLKDRKAARRDPERSAREALHWGAPVLESALTLIADGRVHYRGHDAVELSRTRPLEEVAALLWTGALRVPHGWFGAEKVEPRLDDGSGGTLVGMRIELARAETRDPAAWDLRPERAARTGARILELLTRVAAGGQGDGATASEVLQGAWAPGTPGVEPALRAALILMADHELNVASFSTRCVASAGSTLYAAVSAGIGAMQGVRHAGHSERVAALFREVREPGAAAGVLEARLRRGERVPGFGHRLHPSGDPRAAELLRWARELRPGSPEIAVADALAEAAERMLGDRPAVDFGLVALARALDLPESGPLLLFALGRTIGLVGHALEQYGSASVLRPRARYTGSPPRGGADTGGADTGGV